MEKRRNVNRRCLDGPITNVHQIRCGLRPCTTYRARLEVTRTLRKGQTLSEELLWGDTEMTVKHEQFANLLFLGVEHSLPRLSDEDDHPTHYISSQSDTPRCITMLAAALLRYKQALNGQKRAEKGANSGFWAAMTSCCG